MDKEEILKAIDQLYLEKTKSMDYLQFICNDLKRTVEDIFEDEECLKEQSEFFTDASSYVATLFYDIAGEKSLH